VYALAAAIGLLSAWIADGSLIQGVRKIQVPEAEHGYKHSRSQVINSQDLLDKYLADVAREDGWNDRTTFLRAISDAKVDFSTEVLVLIRHTEASGSIRVRLRLSVGNGGVLTAAIHREVPHGLTADMAYYCFIMVVKRDRAKRVEVLSQDDVLRIPQP
jgi:hypothetical protein